MQPSQNPRHFSGQGPLCDGHPNAVNPHRPVEYCVADPSKTPPIGSPTPPSPDLNESLSPYMRFESILTPSPSHPVAPLIPNILMDGRSPGPYVHAGSKISYTILNPAEKQGFTRGQKLHGPILPLATTRLTLLVSPNNLSSF